MLNKLTGAGRSGNRVVYSLHPFSKLLFTLIFVITAGFAQSFLALLLLSILLLISFKISGAGFKNIVTILKPFIFLLVFTFFVQLFVTKRGGFSLPSLEMLENAGFMTLRMGLIIGFSSLFVLLTTPIDMVRVFNILFKPVELFKISSKDVALSMLIALRFIPLLFIEGSRIADSQRLRGALPFRGEKGSRIGLLKKSMSLVVPLFVRAFQYSSQISITLKYRRHDKAFLALKMLAFRDFTAISVSILFCAGVLYVSKLQ